VVSQFSRFSSVSFPPVSDVYTRSEMRWCASALPPVREDEQAAWMQLRPAIVPEAECLGFAEG